MRVVLQRVSRGEVRVGGQTAGRIGRGFVLLVALAEHDDEATMAWVADKVVSLRVFPDEDGKMNRAANDVGAAFLVVSQFTLYADLARGRRPSFVGAAPPEVAAALYDRFTELLEERAPGRVETGAFGALMDVELVNEGPVTLIIER